MRSRTGWFVGIGALALVLTGWMIPKRRKTTTEKMMDFSWMKDWMGSSIPKMMMRSGRKMFRAIVR